MQEWSLVPLNVYPSHFFEILGWNDLHLNFGALHAIFHNSIFNFFAWSFIFKLFSLKNKVAYQPSVLTYVNRITSSSENF